MFDIWEELIHDFVEEGYNPLTPVEMVVALEIVVYDEEVGIDKAAPEPRWTQEVVPVMADDLDDNWDYDDPELLSYEEMERRDNADKCGSRLRRSMHGLV